MSTLLSVPQCGPSGDAPRLDPRLSPPNFSFFRWGARNCCETTTAKLLLLLLLSPRRRRLVVGVAAVVVVVLVRPPESDNIDIWRRKEEGEACRERGGDSETSMLSSSCSHDLGSFAHPRALP